VNTPDPSARRELEAELETLEAESVARQRIDRVVPWVASLAMHVMFIVIGFLIPWTTAMILSDQPERPTVIADFHHLTPAPLLDISSQEESLDASSERLHEPLLEEDELDSTMPDLLSELASTDTRIGPGPNEALRSFTPRGEGLDVSFGGLHGSNARNIVYIVDASGSMFTYLPIVLDELVQSIDRLGETQSFAVVFFQQNDAIVVPAPGQADPKRKTGSSKKRSKQIKLIPATRANKIHVFDWIDLDHNHIRATGRSNPLEAIKLGLRYTEPTPDVIFILSTDITGMGEYEVDQRDLLKMIRDLNRDKRGEFKTVIKTLQFIEEDPLNTLSLIAEQNGGKDGYRFISREELGL